MSKILYETKGSIAKITINRPEAMNAFDLETARLMGERLKEFDADAALRVIIITGAGDKAFCAGADLKERAGMSAASTSCGTSSGRTGWASVCRRSSP